MFHLRKIHIQNYRALRDLTLDGARRFNLLVGPNDIGKTSALEAMALSITGWRLEGILKATIPLLRDEADNSFSAKWMLASLFSGMKTEKIVISSDFDGGNLGPVQTDLTISPVPLGVGESIVPYGKTENTGSRDDLQAFSKLRSKVNFSGGVTGEVSREIIVHEGGYRLNKIKNSVKSAYPMEEKVEFSLSYVWARHDVARDVISAIDNISRDKSRFDSVVEALRVIEPELTDLRLGRDNFAMAKIKDRTVPIYAMGDGFREILALMGEASMPNNSIMLIDEIGAHIYHNSQPNFLRALLTAARKYNKQIFAVTHSKDTLTALAEVLEENEEFREDTVCFSFLRDKHGDVRATAYPSGAIMHCVKNDIEFR